MTKKLALSIEDETLKLESDSCTPADCEAMLSQGLVQLGKAYGLSELEIKSLVHNAYQQSVESKEEK